MDSLDGMADIEMMAPPTVPNKVNVFGVSTLSTKEISDFIKSLFKSSTHVPEIKVEWIDDDSCNVVFQEDQLVDQVLSFGTPMEGSSEGGVSISVPPANEGEEPQMLEMRRANEADTKNPARSWRDSKFYKKRLELKGINPDTLAPISKVILKPREGAKPLPSQPKVALVPRHIANKARAVMYGEDAFSKRKETKKRPAVESMIVDEEELKKREDRAKRFGSHR
jgi:hypothetical protein